MKRYLAALAGALCLLPVLLMLEFPAGKSPAADSAAFPYQAQDRIDINSAGAAELGLLPGIGPKRAAAIVAYRTQNGPFQTAEELDEVEGISPRMVQELAPYVTMG